jgi:hypothetical protein
VVASIASGGRGLSVSGLPAGYVLSVGDMFHVDWAGGPGRTLHQVAEAVTASGAGATAVFDCDPILPEGAATGAPVGFLRASCLMIRVPGSFDPGLSERGLVTGMRFQAMQAPASATLPEWIFDGGVIVAAPPAPPAPTVSGNLVIT